MTTPTFPLSTPDKPVAIKTSGKWDAFVYVRFADGSMLGEVNGGTGKAGARWTAEGLYLNDCGVAYDVNGFNLIPPEPERQYGYAVWIDDRLHVVDLIESRAVNAANNRRGKIVRQPLARPGEKLCVVPSREDVYDAIASEMYGEISDKTDAVMALLEDM